MLCFFVQTTITFLCIFLVSKILKNNVNACHQNNIIKFKLFCPTNSPKLKDIHQQCS